ncbi:hypothetical protein [Pseudochrobactrum sp. XF203]|uniref:hypothetical protein n=1 Tax=Pseudochrobactrum sp. XF203 TaxID=2879116 RepID=UPI001CE3669E|nr:hypothetical protein [Pseudochrobactrum sp. XF203]UCA46983.1 hypothetical protein LDL70_07205 [Pseudochrobactrum sp. XF203]
MTQDYINKNNSKNKNQLSEEELYFRNLDEESLQLRKKLIETQDRLEMQSAEMALELSSRSKGYEKQRNEMMREISGREKELEKQRNEMMRALSEREKGLEKQRHEMALEYSSREKNLARNTDEMRRSLAEREKELEARYQEVQLRAEENERIHFHRQREIDLEHQNKYNDIRIKQEELDKSLVDFETEKSRYNEENKLRLQINSGAFVNETISKLESKEKEFRLVSYVWSGIGGFVLILGVLFISYITYKSLKDIIETITWQVLTYYTVRGAVVAGLIGVISRYSFVLSNNYMKEGLRTADRIHAIKFGQLYIETYGAAAAWDEVKEAFKNWNADAATNWEDNTKIINAGSSIDDLSSLIDIIKKMKP